MKKVEAIIRPEKLEDLKTALTQSGFAKDMTISQVLGYGNQKGLVEIVRGQRVTPTILAKVIVKDDAVDDLVNAIISVVRTGDVGDGKIFILPIDDAIRIRTGEHGGDAI